MKATRTLLVAALAAAGLAATAYAQNPTTRSSKSLNLSGSRGAPSAPSHGNWNRGGSWHRGGGHWHGHHHHHHWRGARWGFYFGAPILWSTWYWGWPHYGYHPFYYPHTVFYREVERYPMSYPEGTMRDAEPTTDIGPRTEGAPRQGPLYMNYCESAKAYFPKVTSCPEGWKMTSPTQ